MGFIYLYLFIVYATHLTAKRLWVLGTLAGGCLDGSSLAHPNAGDSSPLSGSQRQGPDLPFRGRGRLGRSASSHRHPPAFSFPSEGDAPPRPNLAVGLLAAELGRAEQAREASASCW